MYDAGKRRPPISISRKIQDGSLTVSSPLPCSESLSLIIPRFMGVRRGGKRAFASPWRLKISTTIF